KYFRPPFRCQNQDCLKYCYLKRTFLPFLKSHFLLPIRKKLWLCKRKFTLFVQKNLCGFTQTGKPSFWIKNAIPKNHFCRGRRNKCCFYGRHIAVTQRQLVFAGGFHDWRSVAICLLFQI